MIVLDYHRGKREAKLEAEIRELKEEIKAFNRKTGGGTQLSLARDLLLITLNSYVPKYRFGDYIWGRFHSLQ
jgi:hypothetical protein